MTAILSFLGSAVFRWLLEKVFTIFERRQDHAQEVELRRLQADLDAAQHQRNLDMLERQGRLEIDRLGAESDGRVADAEALAFVESIKVGAAPSGVRWVDGWNGGIRPFVATVACLLWVAALWQQGFRPSEFDQALVGSVIGWFFGTRSLIPGKR